MQQQQYSSYGDRAHERGGNSSMMMMELAQSDGGSSAGSSIGGRSSACSQSSGSGDGGCNSSGSLSSIGSSGGECVRRMHGSLVIVDIVHFRDLSRLLSSARLARTLSRFLDATNLVLPVYGLTGTAFVDGRVVAFGARTREHANDAVRFGLHCLQTASSMLVDEQRPQSGTLALRVAVHTGTVAVMHQSNSSNPPCFVGRTMTEASHLIRKHGAPGEICCSYATIVDLSMESFESITLSSDESWDGKPSAKLGMRVRPDQGSHGFSLCSMCPNTFRLTFQSGPLMPGMPLPGGFGYQPHELRHLRMLFGPDTDLRRFQTAVEQAMRRMKRHIVTTTLYTRAGIPTRVAILLDYIPAVRQLSVTCIEPTDAHEEDALLDVATYSSAARMTGVSSSEEPPPTERNLNSSSKKKTDEEEEDAETLVCDFS